MNFYLQVTHQLGGDSVQLGASVDEDVDESALDLQLAHILVSYGDDVWNKVIEWIFGLVLNDYFFGCDIFLLLLLGRVLVYRDVEAAAVVPVSGAFPVVEAAGVEAG